MYDILLILIFCKKFFVTLEKQGPLCNFVECTAYCCGAVLFRFDWLVVLGVGWLGGAKVLGKLPVPGRPTNLGVVGWCDVVLGKLPVPGRPTIWMIVGQGPIALAVGAGCLDIFLTSITSLFFLPLS